MSCIRATFGNYLTIFAVFFAVSSITLDKIRARPKGVETSGSKMPMNIVESLKPKSFD